MKRFHLGLWLLFFTLALAACSSRPSINDPEKLVSDCAALDKASPEGDIKQDKWPASMAELHPVTVQRHEDSIIIMTYQETGEGAKGYLVNPNAQPTIDHYKLSQVYPGIYNFEFTP